jgi:hypothetical protein
MKPDTCGRSPTASVSSRLTPVFPISGAVMVTSCPWYEGSVRTSWYPVIAVVKTASPVVTPRAPKGRPSNVVPSASTRYARSVFVGSVMLVWAPVGSAR